MTVARSELFLRGIRRIGGRTGTIGGTTSTTTAQLVGLVSTTGDDTFYVGDRLYLPDEAADADRETLITTWTDLTGYAIFPALSVKPTVADRYGLVNREDYALAEMRDAMNHALRESKPTYRQVIPTTPNLPIYPLYQCTWLEGAGDIDQVWLNYSPISLHNEDFALWPRSYATAGPTPPDGWTLSGSGATVSRQQNGIRSAYSARLTYGSGEAQLYQSIPPSLLQFSTRVTAPVLLPWQVGAWVTCSTANIARVGVYNGTSTTWSPFHTGNGQPQWLTPTTAYQSDGTEKDCRIVLSVLTAGNADFHATLLMQNAQLPYQAKDRGSQAYDEVPLNFVPRNVGGIPSVELAGPPAIRGQLVVYSRRKFADMTLDSDLIDDEYQRLIYAGFLRFLLEANKPSQDRTRLDRIMSESADEWTRLLNNHVDLPVPVSPHQYVVGMLAP